jgi:LuxR family maltose regulon positive regulatory protein
VVAPPGYGKTTLLTQWAQHKAPRVGWVTVDRRDNDPAVFLTVIAVALDRIERLDPGVFRTLASPGASVLASAVPHLGAAASAMRQEVALVLDHVELLDNPRCLDAVAELVARLPRGSQLALASRTRPPLPVGLLRARGQVMEVGMHELAMDQFEARALLEGTGLRLDEAQAAELLRRTEGWPVGCTWPPWPSRREAPRSMRASRSAATTGTSPITCARSCWPGFPTRRCRS